MALVATRVRDLRKLGSRGLRAVFRVAWVVVLSQRVPRVLMTRGWRCKKCRHWNPSPWKRICGACGVERKLKKTKHEALLQAARPQYQAMLEAQGGRCAICLRSPTEKRSEER